jgi:PAS domain S-box-containing protein
MEQSVRESEARLRSVLDNVPVFIFNIDRDGTILFVNQTFEGVPVHAAVGVSIYMVMPEQADNFLHEAVKQVFEIGKTQSFEITGCCYRDVHSWYACRIAPVRDNDEIISAIFVATDITARKHAEEELRDSEQRFRTLVEHAPEAIFVLDIDEDHLVDFNENAVRLFKLDREQMLKAGVLDLSPPLQPDNRASAEAALQLIERALDGETPVAEWMHRDAEGRLFACEVRLVRLPSTHRRLVRASVIDIGSRTQAETEEK